MTEPEPLMYKADFTAQREYWSPIGLELVEQDLSQFTAELTRAREIAVGFYRHLLAGQPMALALFHARIARPAVDEGTPLFFTMAGLTRFPHHRRLRAARVGSVPRRQAQGSVGIVEAID